MAARNNDSHKIFDSYVNRLLKEQESEEETVKLPGMPAIPKSGMTAKVPNPFDALMNGETNTYNINAKRVAAARQAQAAQQAQTTQGGATIPGTAPATNQGQTSLSLNTTPDLNLQTTRPGEAVAAGTGAQTGLGSVARTSAEQGGSGSPAPLTTPSSTPSTSSGSSQVATGTPSTEEKELFKKLHGSDYSPGVGDQKLADLRTAVQQTGSTDVSKVAPAAYAQQYVGTPQGAAYAKKVEAMRVPRPGVTNTNYAQQAQQLGLSPETQQDLAGSQQTSAPVAKVSTNTPEYKKWYDEGRQKGFVA